MVEKKTFQQGMAYLAAAYGMELSKERAAVYWDQLGSLRDKPFMQAVRLTVSHGERFPAVAQICAHYRDVIRHEGLNNTLQLPSRKPADRATVMRYIEVIRHRLKRVSG
jgi:hypothetical protein